jgi:hypothetical protein
MDEWPLLVFGFGPSEGSSSAHWASVSVTGSRGAVPPAVDWESRGRLAQLGEHQLDKLGVTGSSPVPPTSEAPANVGLSLFWGGNSAEAVLARVAARSGRRRDEADSSRR